MNIHALTLAVLLAAATGCDTMRNVIWPTAVTCGAPVASQLWTDVRLIAEQDGLGAVFSDRSISMLEDLALSYGPDTVACVLSELLTGKLAPRGVDAIDLPTADRMAAKRVQAFLQHHEIEVTNGEH